MSDKSKLLDLLEEGRINAGDAAKLIAALGPTGAANPEQKRILDMLMTDKLEPEQAVSLLEALATAPQPPQPPRAPIPPMLEKLAKAHGISRQLRINISSSGDDDTDVNLNVPLGLAKFASRFIPEQARQELERQGVNLNDLFEGLDHNIPEGKLLNISANDGQKDVDISIEVK